MTQVDVVFQEFLERSPDNLRRLCAERIAQSLGKSMDLSWATYMLRSELINRCGAVQSVISLQLIQNMLTDELVKRYLHDHS